MVVMGNEWSLKKKKVDQAHTFNARTWEKDKGRVISEFEGSLLYRLHSVIARVTQRSPVWKKKKKFQCGREALERTCIIVSESRVKNSFYFVCVWGGGLLFVLKPHLVAQTALKLLLPVFLAHSPKYLGSQVCTTKAS